jgi:hypothetical protein
MLSTVNSTVLKRERKNTTIIIIVMKMYQFSSSSQLSKSEQDGYWERFFHLAREMYVEKKDPVTHLKYFKRQ